MEDWQEWQIRADQVAASLNQEVDALEAQYLAEDSESSLRGFWSRFRDLKERVRVAPAIKWEDKVELERRLRTAGGRAYKLQEAASSRSAETKEALTAEITTCRERAAGLTNPRELRQLRRELDAIRERFDSGAGLMPADRQALWEAWRETNQETWQRLSSLWEENEAKLRGLLEEARRQAAERNGGGLRQALNRFFDTLKNEETRAATGNALKAEAEQIRREFEQEELRRQSERMASQQAQTVPAAQSWRAELERNRELLARLSAEAEELERQVQASDSILEQAMIRGTMVEKRKKVAELERANRTLEKRIESTEETPVISVS